METPGSYQLSLMGLCIDKQFGQVGVSPKIWARVCICLPLPEKMICKCDCEDGTDEGEVTNPSIDYCIAIQLHHFLHQGEESWKIAITVYHQKDDPGFYKPGG